MRYLDELDGRWENDTITVLIPEFVVSKWYQNILHNQTALALKVALLFRPETIVTPVPYHVDAAPADPRPCEPSEPSETLVGEHT